jgi:hypothetical protein
MLNAAKLALSGAILGLCITGLYYLCYRPYECSVVTNSMKARTLAEWEKAGGQDDWRTPIGARHRIELIEPCLTPWNASVELYMVAAANLRLLKRYDDAVACYRTVLRYDDRPEVYFNLGVTEVEAGHREQGIEDLVFAGRTGSYWNLIEDESVRNEVTRRLFYLPAPRF